MLKRMWGKGNTPPLVVGVQTCTATLEINMVVSQKIENQFQDQVILLLGIYTKDAQLYHKHTCSVMYIAAIFVLFLFFERGFLCSFGACPGTSFCRPGWP